MDRNSSIAFQTEIAKSQNMPVHLLEVFLEDSNGITSGYYLNDSYKNITYNGKDYIAVGHFLGFSDIEETSKIIVSSMTISLSGIDKVWISAILNNNYINRPVKVFVGFLDDNQVLVLDPVLIFEGRTDSPVINEDIEDGKSVLSISATNAWVDFERTTGRHTNNEEQQVLFPGDKGLEFAAQNTQNLVWGQLNPASVGPAIVTGRDMLGGNRQTPATGWNPPNVNPPPQSLFGR